MKRRFLLFVFYMPFLASMAQTNIYESNGKVGIGTSQPLNMLDVNGNIGLATALIPMSINSENAGSYAPLLNFSLNFRESNLNPSYVGAAFRLDSRSNFPLYQWLIRPPGQAFEQEVVAMALTRDGNLGIGTGTPQERLSVNGMIRAKEVKIEVSNWPDYVFEQAYSLPTLAELKAYVYHNKRLPEVPSASEVAEKGIDIGAMNARLLKKIEELTLYLFEKDEEIRRSNERIEAIEKKLNKTNSN